MAELSNILLLLVCTHRVPGMVRNVRTIFTGLRGWSKIHGVDFGCKERSLNHVCYVRVTMTRGFSWNIWYPIQCYKSMVDFELSQSLAGYIVIKVSLAVRIRVPLRAP